MLIAICHPKWQEVLYGDESQLFYDHAKSIEAALLRLREALIVFPIISKADVARLSRFRPVEEAVTKVKAAHEQISDYSSACGQGDLSLRTTDRLLHYLPTAWEWRFARRVGRVQVTLIDDKKVAGWFGQKSCVSTDRGEHDIYLEYVYALAEDGTTQDAEVERGILIHSDKIKHIEFFD